jgi:hypothetical protein
MLTTLANKISQRLETLTATSEPGNADDAAMGTFPVASVASATLELTSPEYDG